MLQETEKLIGKINAQIAQNEHYLDITKETLADVTLRLIKHPDDKELIGSLNQFEAEVQKYERKVNQLIMARDKAMNIDTEAESAAEAELKAKATKEYLNLLKQRIHPAKAIMDDMAKVVNNLADLQAITTQALRKKYEAGLKRPNEADSFMVACGAQIANLMIQAGFTTQLEFVSCRRPLGYNMGLDEIAQDRYEHGKNQVEHAKGE